MKVLIYSDCHGNLESLEIIKTLFEKQYIDTAFSLGDNIGYMTNPNECLEFLRKFNIESCLGNHELAVFNNEELSNFNPIPAKALLWTRENISSENLEYIKSFPKIIVKKEYDITLSHTDIVFNRYIYSKNLFYIQANLEKIDTKLMFIGHTHIPFISYLNKNKVINIEVIFNKKIYLNKDFKYMINVGSLGQPRDGIILSSFIIYDTEDYSITFYRTNYNRKRTISKLLENNMPTFLSERLLLGK